MRHRNRGRGRAHGKGKQVAYLCAGGSHRNKSQTTYQPKPPPFSPLSWVDVASGLNDSNIHNIFHAHYPPCTRLNHNSKGNCTNNPNCIYGLGESTKEGIWGEDKNSVGNAVVTELWPTINSEQDLRMRDLEKEKCGLRNFGTTCYLNSVIQILFMNDNFKSLILQINDDHFMNLQDNQKFREFIENLQILFWNLDISIRTFYEPLLFITFLNLKKNVQQDVEEFQKLIINFIFDNLKSLKSDHFPFAKRLTHLFKGNLEYATTCDKCKTVSRQKSSFFEININFPPDLNPKSNSHLNLYDILCEKFAVAEILSDESNKYNCEKCGTFEIAQRQTSILRLPIYLTFQLLRFEYDIKNSKKYKISTPITFPEFLDMSPFLSSQNTSNDNKKNPEKTENVWELVGVILHKGESANGGHYVANAKDVTTNKWWNFDDEQVKEIPWKNIGGAQVSMPKPAAPTKQPVDNTAWKTVGGRKRRNNNTTTTGDAIVDGVKSNGERVVVSSEVYMIVYRKKDEGKENIKTTTTTSQNANNTLKIVPTKKKVEIENNEFLENLTKFQKRKEQEIQKIRKLKETYNENISHFIVKSDEQSWAWVPKIVLERFVKGQFEEPFKPEDINLECEKHGKLDPHKLTKMKRVSKKGAILLRSYFADESIPLEKWNEMGICFDCAGEKYSDLVLSKERAKYKKQIMDEFKIDLNGSISNALKSTGFWVSKNFLNIFKEKFEISTGEWEGEISQMDINQEIVCEHGGLVLNPDNQVRKVISPELWKFLLSLATSSTEFPFKSSTECEVCKARAEELQKQEQILKDTKEAERKEFFELFAQVGRSKKKTNKRVVLEEGIYYIVDRKWIHKWRNFVDFNSFVANGKQDLAPMTSGELLCEHRKFLYEISGENLEKLKEKEKEWVEIPNEIYEKLAGKHGKENTKNEILVEVKNLVENDKKIKQFELWIVKENGDKEKGEICEECLEARKKREEHERFFYEEANLMVQVEGGRCGNVSIKAERKPVKVSCLDNVGHLKLLILQEFEISPDIQELYFGDLPLGNSTLTLQEYKVPKDGVVKVRITDGEYVYNADDFGGDVVTTEEGFEGTTLLGNVPTGGQDDDDEEDDELWEDIHQIEQLEQSSSAGWTCKACTFVNLNSSATSCEICETSRQT